MTFNAGTVRPLGGVDLDALEKQHGLPPGILAATRKVESGNGRNLHSGVADGSMQFTPATARAMGIDPMDDRQAIPAAAKLWADNLKASGGDIDRAAMMYHGGPNTRQWGPKTKAYPGKLLAALGTSQAAAAEAPQADDNPFRAAAPRTAGPPPADDNPFRSQPVGANGGGNAPRSSMGSGLVPVATGPGVRAPAGGVAGPAAPLPQLGAVPGGNGRAPIAPPVGPNAASAQAGLQGRPPGDGGGVGAPPVPANAGNVLRGVRPPTSDPYAANAAVAGAQGRQLADAIVNLPQGLQNIKQGGLELIGRGTDAIGLTDGFADRVAAQRAEGQAATDRRTIDPQGIGAQTGQIGGEMLGTAPLSAIKALRYLPKGANAAYDALKAGGEVALTKGERFARYLASTGDAALQGAVGGAVAGRPGSNVGGNAGIGSGVGATVGALSPVAGRIVAGTVDAIAPRAKSLARYLTGAAPETAPALRTANVPQQALADAVASGGTRRSLLANAHLTPEIKAQVGMLVAKGVPLDQAIREAEARAIGALPRVSDVNRNFADQQATREGAKLNTPEGRALMERETANNAAAHNAHAQLVEGYGGVPAHGEAMQTAAKVLAGASDAAKTKVSSLYTTAEKAAPGVTVRPDALRETLASVGFQTPKTAAGKAFASGMRADLKILTNPVKGGARGLKASDLERLRQSANEAYDATGSAEVNRMVGQVKAAIDQHFDELGESGPAYKAARKAHKAWADAYDIPGIADLTKRDAAGNFVADWRKLDRNIVSSMADKPFANMVGRLKASGNADALDKIKASVLQDAYEAVTKTAHDSGGHATFNGRRWLQQLDSLGHDKLTALFTPDELGKISAYGRGAMHVNDPVPGAVNNSSTGSTIANTLMAAQKAAEKYGGKAEMGWRDLAQHGGALATGVMTGHELLTVGGSLAASAVGKAVGARGASKAAKGLSAALTQAADPEAARLAAAARRQALAQALRNQEVGGMAARFAAPAGAAAGGSR